MNIPIRSRRSALATTLALTALGAGASTAGAAVERINVAPDSSQVPRSAGDADISADGRFAAFGEFASNLVAGDTNGAPDIFLRDLGRGANTRVSVGAGGAQANGPSFGAAVSGDGRVVAFSTQASNLVAGDTNGREDVFVRDLAAGTTERISLGAAGEQPTAQINDLEISENGRFVGFSTASVLTPGDTNGASDIFVRDRQNGGLERLGAGAGNVQGNGFSFEPSLSADGRFVSFHSSAANLVADDTNNLTDVFVKDRASGSVQRVSVSSSGGQANRASGQSSISADGRVVAFNSGATNLVAGDGDVTSDMFAFDRRTATIERISTAADGTPGDATSAFGSVSPDGRLVAFMSNADNLGSGSQSGDLMVRDRLTGALRVAVPDVVSDDGSEIHPRVDALGRAMVFTSEREGVVPGDDFGFDAFVTRPVRDDLRVASSRLDFGAQAKSTASNVQTLEVRGPDATLPSLVGSVRLTGASADQFLLVRDECTGRLLEAGESCAIGVRFAPTDTSRGVVASLRVAEAGGQALDVAVAGTGTAPPAAGVTGPAGAPGPAGPTGATGAPGPQGPKGEPGRVICKTTAIRFCETIFAPGSFGTATALMSLTRDGRTVAQAKTRLQADRSTRLVLRRPRGLRPGRYRLTVAVQRAAGRQVVARKTVRVQRAG